mmetsp:Transcript_7582/g.27479  ORF Transcript_7582/g.27479 Transcript_7582/m.27479 type:complete len:243 (+) Transcript_7582:3247-3975(+)
MEPERVHDSPEDRRGLGLELPLRQAAHHLVHDIQGVLVDAGLLGELQALEGKAKDTDTGRLGLCGRRDVVQRLQSKLDPVPCLRDHVDLPMEEGFGSKPCGGLQVGRPNPLGIRALLLRRPLQVDQELQGGQKAVQKGSHVVELGEVQGLQCEEGRVEPQRLLILQDLLDPLEPVFHLTCGGFLAPLGRPRAALGLGGRPAPVDQPHQRGLHHLGVLLNSRDLLTRHRAHDLRIILVRQVGQ